jgi:hypothetical protein|nr:MAG TPA: hypothetical protein [Caudoviricetes sp.]
MPARVRPRSPEADEGVAVGGSRCRCCAPDVLAVSGGRGGGCFITSFNKQQEKINILQKSYIKIWLYNFFVVPLQLIK